MSFMDWVRLVFCIVETLLIIQLILILLKWKR